MAVTAQDVREVLPQATNVSDELINEFVAAWQARADLAIGTSDDSRLQTAVESAVRMGAASDVLRALWSGSSIEEPGNAKAMSQQAEEVIKALDATTSNPSEASSDVFEGLVSEPNSHLWKSSEFLPHWASDGS